MGTKLSILTDSNLSSSNSGWQDRTHPISSSEIIHKIEDPNAVKVTNILTAVPSPIARYHVFDIAFQYLGEFLRKKKKIDNTNTFFKLVSEALDALEIVFYFEYLKQAYPELKIYSMDIDSIINTLKNSPIKEHKRFGSVLDKYFSSVPFNNIRNQSFIIKYDSHIVAITSPLTIVVVPEDKNFNLYSVFGPQRSFFDSDHPLHLRKRDGDFIYYLYSVKKYFQQNFPEIRSLDNFFKYLDEEKSLLEDPILINKIDTIDNQSMGQYVSLKTDNAADVHLFGKPIKIKSKTAIEMAHKIKSTYKINYATDPDFNCAPVVLKDGYDPITGKQDTKSIFNFEDKLNFKDRTIPNRGIKYPTICLNDFFETNLIMVDYKIADDFVKPIGISAGLDYSFLLPIKPLYFKFFSIEDLKTNLSFFEDKEDCRFDLKIPVGEGKILTLQRRYSRRSAGGENSGRIQKLQFGMAFFPLIRYFNPKFNDYYSVMLVDGEYNDSISSSSHIKLEFFESGYQEFEKKAGNSISSGVRYKKDKSRGVTFYELNNTFDFIRLSFGGFGIELSGMVIPIWMLKGTGTEPGFNVAVDLGTTNTSLAIKENGIPKTVEFSQSEKYLVTFNSQVVNDDNSDGFGVITEKKGSLREINFNHSLNSYMLPVSITKGGLINFPVRSVIYEGNQSAKPELGLFNYRNIPFAFYKVTKYSSDTYYTNLKWEKSSNVLNNARVKDFMRELLLLARIKIISAGGDPSKSQLITFKPSSLSSSIARTVVGEWQGIFSKIFKTTNNPESITESAAPAFYLWKNSKLQGGRMFGDYSTLIIDIGGGSTDVAVFKKNKLVLQTSLKFAGNDIWSPGMCEYFWDQFSTHSRAFTEPNHQLLIGNYFLGERPTKDFFEKSGYEQFNFIFSADESLEKIGVNNLFKNLLESNNALKFVVLYYFSSIIYHILDIMKLKEFDISNVRFINLTGKGSNIIKLLETVVGSRPIGLERIIQKLFNSFCEMTSRNIEIHLVSDSKEITAWGGLEWLESNRDNSDIPESSPIYYLGTGEKVDIFESARPIEVKKFSIYKEKVNDNILKFHEILFKVLSEDTDLNDELDINCLRDAKRWKESISIKTLSDNFDIMYGSLEGKYDLEVNHSVFFEPIKILMEDLFLTLINKE